MRFVVIHTSGKFRSGDERTLIHSYFTVSSKKTESEIIVKPIVEEIVNNASADSTFIARTLVDEIDLALEKVVKLKVEMQTHRGPSWEEYNSWMET